MKWLPSEMVTQSVPSKGDEFTHPDILATEG